ncbi:MAG: neuraminidase-like domain-containing protein [Novosphingobium sp.]
MPQVILVRIVPKLPTSGAAFSAYLSNLSIRAFDHSFADTAGATLIGSAQGAWIPDAGLNAAGPPFDPNTQRILQHWTVYPVQINPFPQPATPDVRLEAVATAVIALTSPPATEFSSSDIRLEIKQGTQLVAYEQVSFNVKVEPNAAISGNPSTYVGVAVPALVVTIPDPVVSIDPNSAFVELPTDGSPPKFAPLLTAIDKVLLQDPAGGATLANRSPLTQAQALHVAREIIWNPQITPPPPLPQGRTLGDLYTRPQTNTTWSTDDRDKADMDRKQYEASLLGHYALQTANSNRLAQYVFAASAAVWAQQQSAAPGRAGLIFPVETGVPPQPGTTFRKAQAIVHDQGGLTLNFEVPAGYFYALSAILANTVSAEQRYRMATDENPERLAATIETAIAAKVITAGAITPANAARRLAAIGLGRAQRHPLVPLNAGVQALVNAWLAHAAPSIDPFWQAAPFPAGLLAGQLELVLAVATQQTTVTPNSQALIAAIKAIPVTTVAQLKARTVQDWHAFFLPANAGLLPEFTKPGTAAERVDAFVRQLRKYFDILSVAPAPTPATSADALAIPIADGDPLRAFLAAAPGFSFPVANFTAPSIVAALAAVFPGDRAAQDWLLNALQTIDELFRATSGVGPADLQFSLIEALYARGFTARAQIQAQSADEFAYALTGTVAYPHADAIQLAAGGPGGAPATGPVGPFVPINPDGSLINCIPPWHLSPFGPAKYLQDLLATGEGATCADPRPSGATLATLLAGRRGPLADLHASAANIHAAIPLIDIVNENLEALADGSAGGVVYDTSANAAENRAYEVLRAAIPEHSSPATPVKRPGAYAKLAADFSAPGLPYSQPLDIARSYLAAMGTSRFATMRAFRSDITEFAIDAGQEAADFQKHLWRYPVRIELAVEYLGLSSAEYETLFVNPIDSTALRGMYGFAADTISGRDWKDFVAHVPEFLARTGLDYCEFLELWKSGFITFQREPSPANLRGNGGEPVDSSFPDCEPCCPEDLVIGFVGPDKPEAAFYRLMIFIRLWRTLQCVNGAAYSFNELRDICEVLGLFAGAAVNPGFIRQLAAFQMLRDDWQLDLGIDQNAGAAAHGADRTRLLGLWAPGQTAAFDWALDHLLARLEDRAEREHAPARLPGSHRRHRPPEFIKILRANLDPLATLGGFDPATSPWNAAPTGTLRFTEILAKLYASSFTTGELLYLFAVDQHLDGDDPFALQDSLEALDQPFDFPEDGHPFDLWTLRSRLLGAAVADDDASALTWPALVTTMQRDFGYDPAADGDPLQLLGKHFFPDVLRRAGVGIDPQAQQYRTSLATTVASMWNTPEKTPFRYDAATKELVAELPLNDAAVLAQLNAIEQLTTEEHAAVQQLYFAPRAELARFAFLFPGLAAAEQALIEEPDEARRWDYFRRGFATFTKRAGIVADHLAGHVGDATGDAAADAGLARVILRRLLGDENTASAPWEQDSGQPPAPFAWSQPGGGALAALTRLTGTGLPGAIAAASGATWPHQTGSLAMFAPAGNAWNAPAPTVVPDIMLALPASARKFAFVRNGLALRESDGLALAGAEGFKARWSGVLIVEQPGTYTFFAGGPTPDPALPDFACCGHNKWRVNLRRGQKTFLLLNYRWEGEPAPDRVSGPLNLKRGAYFIDIDFAELPPEFDEELELARAASGFAIKYQGPDTADCIATVPFERLFRDAVAAPLASKQAISKSARDYLALQYTGSIRDIRRTYQRAFKALLFSHRLGLSADIATRVNTSEIEYLLGAGESFAGTSYRPGTPYTAHRAWLDFNLLPVGDSYRGDPTRQPPAALDARADPTVARRAAMFDWFERLFDYTAMRASVRHCSDRSAWLCFVEAANQQPTDPIPLLTDLEIDLDCGRLVLDFHDGVQLNWTQLVDERWPLRVWHAARWIKQLLRGFVPLDLAAADPDLWASTQFAASNVSLTGFFRDGMIGRGDPLRFADVELLNNGLRLRARCALVAYLTGMDRVPLPFAPGQFATSAKDLSALLLTDVEAGIDQSASRVEEAASAVQGFVERARLSREPSFAVGPEFGAMWDKLFASFRIWQVCRRRTIYRENQIEWSEHEVAARTEAFRFLESELRRSALTAPVPGGMEYWPGPDLPVYPTLSALQHREPAQIRQVAQPQNLGLMGRPERHARPSWLAPSAREITVDQSPPNDNAPGIPLAANPGAATPNPEPAKPQGLPLWLQAAVRIGTRFLRIAAAGEPMASSGFAPAPANGSPCCHDCGAVHPPVMDEYYFWLVKSEYYDPASLNPADPSNYQDADWGVVPPDMTSDWHRTDKLPQRLAWAKRPMVRLAWCRVHNGEFQTPRFTDTGARVNPAGGEAELEFLGRKGDSLRFGITNAASLPPGHLDPAPWGFRYDIGSDTAVVLPELVEAQQLPAPLPGLSAYPFFIYAMPGAPLEPSLYSTVMTVATTLRNHCRYEAALSWYELSFAPTTNDLRWATCRIARQPTTDQPSTVGNVPANDRPTGNANGDPAGNPNARPTSGTADGPNTGTVLRRGSGTSVRMATAPRHPRSELDPCCDSLAKSDLAARERSVLLAYLETLLDFSKAALCRHSPESYAMAGLRLDAAAALLGERPRTIYATDDDDAAATIATLVPRFPPLNPRLMHIYDRVNDELDALHNLQTKSRLRSGTLHRDTSYWGDDPVRRGWKTVANECLDDDGCCCPPSPYRFPFLLQRALETAAETRALGDKLLAAIEKGDAEYLAAMRAGHERQLLNLTEEIRNFEFREADWQIQALRKTKEATQAKRQYYADLIATGLIPKEQAYQNLTGVSMSTRAAGNAVEAVGQVMNLIPDNTTGVAGVASSPVSVFQMPIGTKLAHAFSAGARILTTVADVTGTQASLAMTEAGWDRREADWIFQVTVLDIEIQQIERQILAAERRRDTALRQLNNLVQQMEQSAEIQDFLRDKFTSHARYLFIQTETAALLRQMFDIAWCWALQAQRAFQLERDLTTQSFLPPKVWDGVQEGLLSGERLSGALRTMEKAYFDQDKRRHELVTRLSLRLDFPLAFLQLKTTGACEIEIPEWRFDREYPGHYMRRIKAVSLTIPAVAGPYSGVHCKLTLLSSATRTEPTLLDIEQCCPGTCTCGCCERRRYEPVIDDPRIVKRYGALEAVATSTGQNDAGLFQLDFRDERYLPFEFAGAVSRWRIELPIETNSFDTDTVSDLAVQLSYTALEGGDPLGRASWAAASCMLPGGGLRMFDWRQDLSEAWQRFKMEEQAEAGGAAGPALALRMNRSMFPYLAGERPVRMHRVSLWFEARPCDGANNLQVEFIPGRDEHGKVLCHGDDECCERYAITCVASADWPCLFHGVLDFPFPYLEDERPTAIGAFAFPETAGEIRRAYMVCSYEAGEPRRCLPQVPGCEPECLSCH